jgi:hypothetical protein
VDVVGVFGRTRHQGFQNGNINFVILIGYIRNSDDGIHLQACCPSFLSTGYSCSEGAEGSYNKQEAALGQALFTGKAKLRQLSDSTSLY